MPRGKSTACGCGCGEPTQASMRMRKVSCDCGACIIRVSRQTLATLNASCIECGSPLLAVCLYDRAHVGDADAIAELEAREDRAAVRREPRSPGRRAPMFRCGDCQAIRKPHGACKACGSERPPTTSFMHPRAARIVGGDVPMAF